MTMEKEASRCNVTALRKAARHISQFYDTILSESGMRATQRAILVATAREGSPTIGELASALVLDRTALNHNLKPLQRDGLLVIAADAGDRRSKRVKLTRRGEARLANPRARGGALRIVSKPRSEQRKRLHFAKHWPWSRRLISRELTLNERLFRSSR